MEVTKSIKITCEYMEALKEQREMQERKRRLTFEANEQASVPEKALINRRIEWKNLKNPKL